MDGANPFVGDDWDWPYILYVGRVWLRYTDEQIWALTPRQFKTQLDVHADIKRRMYSSSEKESSQNAQPGYIDQMPGW